MSGSRIRSRSWCNFHFFKIVCICFSIFISFPSEQSPLTIILFCQRLLYPSKYFWDSFHCMYFGLLCVFSFMSLVLWDRCFFIAFSINSCRKKSAEEYGDWEITTLSFFARNFLTSNDARVRSSILSDQKIAEITDIQLSQGTIKSEVIGRFK